MYGGIQFWKKSEQFENAYYAIAYRKPSPLTDQFDETYFQDLLASAEVQKLPLKAALATEQRIPGLGNGCLQDILWKAKLHPKRRVSTLSSIELQPLFTVLKNTLTKMTRSGGRSTEKDLFGTPGGYQVIMCSDNYGKPCPVCDSLIIKESYMGGSIYTCSQCQPTR